MSHNAVATEHHHDTDETDVFGFWIYIMSDCILFACLFATFIVLRDNTYNGFGIKQFLDLPYVLKETVLLLTSSLTFGFASIAAYKKCSKKVMLWLFITFLLGAGFIYLELKEFHHLIVEGHGPTTSAAMSGFFALVGTHGLHVTVGLVWMLIMMVQLVVYKVNGTVSRRLTYLGLFWAFLDIVWIFVYTIVYLMGGI